MNVRSTLIYSLLVTLLATPLFAQDAPGYQKLAEKTAQLANQGKYDEALVTAREANRVAVEFAGADSWIAAVSGLNLGELLRRHGDLDEATSVIEHAIEIGEKSPDKDDTMLASMKSTVALIYATKGQYNDAIKNYEENLATLKNVKGEESEEVALVLNDLGEVYRRQQRFDEAGKALKRAIEISEKNGKTDELYMAYRYNNLGLLGSDMNDPAAAQANYSRSVEIFEKNVPPDNVELATTRMNLGTAMYSQGNVGAADSLYRLSLASFEKHYSADHLQIAQVKANLGLVNLSMDKPDEAEPFLKESIDGFEKIDPNYPGIEPLYNAYAMLLFNADRIEEATALKERAAKRGGGMVKPTTTGADEKKKRP